MTDIADRILGGEADDDLDGVIEAVQARRKVVAKRNLSLFTEGDKVRVGRISPKYLVGATGTVTGITNTRIEVKLDEPRGKFTTLLPVGFPPSTLSIITGGEA